MAVKITSKQNNSIIDYFDGVLGNVLLTFLCITLLMPALLDRVSHMAKSFHLVDLSSYLVPAKMEATLYYAEHGYWPNQQKEVARIEALAEGSGYAASVKSFSVQNGQQLVYELPEEYLSGRPPYFVYQVKPNDKSAFIRWECATQTPQQQPTINLNFLCHAGREPLEN